MSSLVRISVAVLLVAIVVACGSAAPVGPQQFVAIGAASPTSRTPATPLATEPSDTAAPTSNASPTAKLKPTPKPTPKPTARPTPKPASFYKPPGWDGNSDVDCPDFDTHAHAQSFFKGTGGSPSNDPYRLDGNHDGIACETLP